MRGGRGPRDPLPTLPAGGLFLQKTFFFSTLLGFLCRHVLVPSGHAVLQSTTGHLAGGHRLQAANPDTRHPGALVQRGSVRPEGQRLVVQPHRVQGARWCLLHSANTPESKRALWDRLATCFLTPGAAARSPAQRTASDSSTPRFSPCVPREHKTRVVLAGCASPAAQTLIVKQGWVFDTFSKVKGFYLFIYLLDIPRF